MDLEKLSKQELIDLFYSLEQAVGMALMSDLYDETAEVDSEDESWDGYHEFRCEQDGDGYNEPHSTDYSCTCGDWGLSWVQTDPTCSDSIPFSAALIQWSDHAARRVYGENNDEYFDSDEQPTFTDDLTF